MPVAVPIASHTTVPLKPKTFTPRSNPPHPLSTLQPDELRVAARVVKEYNSTKKCLFRRILLIEPPKNEVVPYLEAELAGKPLPKPPIRRAQVRPLPLEPSEVPRLITLVSAGPLLLRRRNRVHGGYGRHD